MRSRPAHGAGESHCIGRSDAALVGGHSAPCSRYSDRPDALPHVLIAARSIARSTQLAARHACVVLVLAALVCAQALGFMHQASHARHGGGPHDAPLHAVSHVHDHGAAADDGEPHDGETSHRHDASHAHADAHAVGWLQSLFGGHGDASECRLYDGIGLQLFACPAALPVSVIAAGSLYLRLLESDFVARRSALFDARGPPLSR
jgi:hypothetical protein